jgi:hypothetical protein
MRRLLLIPKNTKNWYYPARRNTLPSIIASPAAIAAMPTM